MRKFPVVPALLAFALLNAVTAPPVAAGDAPDDPAGGHPVQASPWGSIPAPLDSTTRRFEPHGMPVWEGAVVWPWRVVTFPVKAAWCGLGTGIVFLDEHRVIDRVGALLSPPELPWGFTTNLGAGGLTGLAGGVTFYHNEFLGDANRFRLGTQLSTSASRKVNLGLRFRDDSPIGVELGAGYRLRRNARFFGLGPEALEEDESFYTQELTWGGLTLRHRPAAGLDVAVTGLYSAAGARGPREQNTPGLADRFADRLPAGFGRRSDGYSAGVEIHHENFVETGRPEHGGLRRARAVYFAETGDGSAAFWTYRGELQQFIPLWNSRRALALRGVLSWIDPAGGGPVPFQRLMTNDDPDQLRGFRDFRWHDRGLVLASAEYRWPLWVVKSATGAGLDAYLLADWGQVFGDFRDVSLDHLTASYGGGVRFLSTKSFLFRVEYARSGDESVVRLAASQDFQFSKSGLFHGRNPVPER